MGNGILAFVEQRNNTLVKAAKEVLSAGKQLATESGTALSAVVIGDGVSGLTEDIGKFGPDRIFTADDAQFGSYSALAYAEVITRVIDEVQPDVVLFAADSMGRDLAPVVAAKHQCGNGSDITEIHYNGSTVTAQQPVYAGKSLVNITFNKLPAFATLRPNTFPPEENPSDSEVKAVDITLSESATQCQVIEFNESESERPELTEATRIVSGGRGVGYPEQFSLIEDLADVLHAAVGASRAVVDAGWRPHSEQVGQTGKTVSPALYVACGISGAIQHLAGMRSSKVIVAINKDPDAPIFKIADYGIVADLFEVVPRLIEELKSHS